MLVNGFLFALLNEVGIEILFRVVDALNDHEKSLKTEKDLADQIISYLGEEEKLFKSNKEGWNYDFESLRNTLLSLILNKESLRKVFDSDTTVRKTEINRIYSLCNETARPHGKSSEQRVRQIVDVCYEKTLMFYAETISVTDYYLVQKGVSAINSHIDDSTNAVLELINESIRKISELNENMMRMMHTLSQFPAITHIRITSDNRQFLGIYKDCLFLDRGNKNITLDKLYIEPLVASTKKTVSECLNNWINSNCHCMILYGEAGVGKSSLVSRLIDVACLNNGCMDNPDDAPVLAVALRDHCNVFSKLENSYSAKDVLCELFGARSCAELEHKMLILDGFDELTVLIPSFDRKRANSFIRNLCQMCENIHLDLHVLITSREGYFDDDFNGCVVENETLCWTGAQVSKWCEEYGKHKPESKEWCASFIQQYDKLPQNSLSDKRYEILCIPFILYLCSNSGVDLDKNKTVCQIYDQSFRTLLLRKHNEFLVGSEYFIKNYSEEQRRLIYWQFTKELAFQMFLLNDLTLSDSIELPDGKLTGLERAKKRTVEILKEKYDFTLFDEDLVSNEFLAVFTFAKSDGQKGITFAHKTVYEYFTAIKIYEDFFADVHDQYFDLLTEDKRIEEVVNRTIGAFRYKAIPREVFSYLVDLCKESKPPFSHFKYDDCKGFDYELYEKIFVQALKSNSEYILAVQAPVREYIELWELVYKSESDNESELFQPSKFASISLQISRAYSNVTWFLTKQGYKNQNNSFHWFVSTVFSESDQPVNMKEWYLRKYCFKNANLSGAVLSGAILSGSDLGNAHMRNCYLDNAKLNQALLNEVDLASAVLVETDMSGCCLIGANLNQADLHEAILFEVDFSQADLRGTNLAEARTIEKAIFYGANLSELDLSGLNLSGIDLRKADMSSSKLKNADLRKADLRGTDLRGTDLELAKLKHAVYCNNGKNPTLFPDGFSPEKYDMIAGTIL